jgi:hypothetical protein
MPRGPRSSRRAGRPTRPGGRRGLAARAKAGGRNRRKSKFGGKRPGVTRRKGEAKQRKATRIRNKGENRVRGRQSGGGGKASSFTARPIGRTLGVALAGKSPPAGERGAWEFGKAKAAESAPPEEGAPEFTRQRSGRGKAKRYGLAFSSPRFAFSWTVAWRINQSVLRGEIDNRTRGRVVGRIWLSGRAEPVALDLSGNCWRDLAGCVLRFDNPKPSAVEDERSELAGMQEGIAGDITASRKVRVLDVSLEAARRLSQAGETPPEHLANSLYLEWFSEANGRVVIESADYKIDISAPAWVLSPEEEQEQIAAAQQAMRDWLERLDEALQAQQPEEFDPDEDKPLDEFGYEKLMRESDARTDKYMELLEKYEGHPDREKIVAREMGWTWLEEALEADERGALPHEQFEVPPLEPNPLTEGVDWVRDEDGRIRHPLSKRAFESGVAIWHYCDDRGLLGENADVDLADMVFQFQTTGAKIAGALNGLAYDDGTREGGFVVAALKRALKYLHASMAAGEKVAAKNVLDPARLESFRAELFAVREEILALMERYRSKPL